MSGLGGDGSIFLNSEERIKAEIYMIGKAEIYMIGIQEAVGNFLNSPFDIWGGCDKIVSGIERMAIPFRYKILLFRRDSLNTNRRYCTIREQ